MRVAAVQTTARFAEPARVVAEADLLLASVGPVDIAVLPEAALTGYLAPSFACDLAPFAEPVGGASTSSLAELARRHRCHLLGPLVERDGARCFNSALLFDPAGNVLAKYRKRHPWYPEGWASGSPELPFVTDVGGLNVTVSICFDVHFLDEVEQSLRRADLLLFPSAWVADENGVDGREELLSAVARKFEVGVVNANWGAGTPAVRGQGHSMLLDAGGRLQARSGTHAEVAVTNFAG